MARAAIVDDLPAIERLHAAAGVRVPRASLEGRIADPDGGLLIVAGGAAACVSWAVDGGTVHLYDFAGDRARYAELVDAANAVARIRCCAVLAASVYEHDRFAGGAESLGFVRDWDELDVRAGRPERLVGFVREVV